MKFYNEKDLENGGFERGWKIIDALHKEAEKQTKKLCESTTPEFKTIEEARAYYGSIPFSEWEKRMKERLGLDELPYERFDKEGDSEGQKMKEFYDSMFMKQYARDQEIAIITDKKPSDNKLRATLLRHGYGIKTIKGSWHEELQEDDDSIFVVNLPYKDGEIDPLFKQHIVEILAQAHQDSFTYSPQGKIKGYVVGVNNGQYDEMMDFQTKISELAPPVYLETLYSYNIIARDLIEKDAREMCRQ